MIVKRGQFIFDCFVSFLSSPCADHRLMPSVSSTLLAFLLLRSNWICVTLRFATDVAIAIIAICKSQLHSNEVSLFVNPMIYFVIATDSPAICPIPVPLLIALRDCHATTIAIFAIRALIVLLAVR